MRRNVPCTLEPTVTEHYDVASYKDPSGVDILLSTTAWPVWGDGFRDERAPAYRLAATG